MTAHAQLGNLLQKAKDKGTQKASEAIDKKLDGKTSGNNTTGSDSEEAAANGTTNSHKRLSVESVFDFVPADSVLYTSRFDMLPTGVLPAAWKTNGSGQLVKVGEFPGSWLQVQENATYKLKQNLILPENGTIEFDILTSCDKVKDLSPVQFGVAENNSVSDWNEGDIAHVELMYYNDNEVSSFAHFGNKYNSVTFDLNPYANAKMHVSIVLKGQQMKVYLDKTKVLDAQMFKENARKYFYFSAPLEMKNDAKVFFGNVRIAE
ncbi:hypothetical protein DCM91_10920 [Chitinophaga costaii]|nr:hypothetical protein DCM91_10920 [Chitinophaga costaii]